MTDPLFNHSLETTQEEQDNLLHRAILICRGAVMILMVSPFLIAGFDLLIWSLDRVAPNAAEQLSKAPWLAGFGVAYALFVQMLRRAALRMMLRSGKVKVSRRPSPFFFGKALAALAEPVRSICGSYFGTLLFFCLLQVVPAVWGLSILFLTGSLFWALFLCGVSLFFKATCFPKETLLRQMARATGHGRDSS